MYLHIERKKRELRSNKISINILYLVLSEQGPVSPKCLFDIP